MQACRLAGSLQGDQAAGHWRASNRGVMGFMTVTSGASVAQLSVVRGSDLSESQADTAGSIPVTRSTEIPGQRPGRLRQAVENGFCIVRWPMPTIAGRAAANLRLFGLADCAETA